MNADTHQNVLIGQLNDIPCRGARRVHIDNRVVAVFRTSDDQVFAVEDRCPHKAGPLSEGIVHDNCVTCPLHNWVIDLTTGLAKGADDGQVDAFVVVQNNNEIYLTLPLSKLVSSIDHE